MKIKYIDAFDEYWNIHKGIVHLMILTQTYCENSRISPMFCNEDIGEMIMDLSCDLFNLTNEYNEKFQYML